MTNPVMPKWATPDRKNSLVELFLSSGGFCVYGHKPCIGYSETLSTTACALGKICNNPMPDGHLCRYKPEPDTPHLHCKGVIVKTKTRWHCAYGDYPCYKPFGSHYENYADNLIADWKQSDRQDRLGLWQAEQRAMHSLGERTYPVTGRFSAISRDIYHDNQPLYYLDGQSVSGLTLLPFVMVRIASGYMRLFVDLGTELRQVSKSKRRKAIRYGKPLPQETEAIIRRKVLQAVRDYLAH